jgi:hypothetical protein
VGVVGVTYQEGREKQASSEDEEKEDKCGSKVQILCS